MTLNLDRRTYRRHLCRLAFSKRTPQNPGNLVLNPTAGTKRGLRLLVVSAPLARGVGGVENPKPDKVMVWVGGVGTSTHAPTPQPLYGGGSSALAEKP